MSHRAGACRSSSPGLRRLLLAALTMAFWPATADAVTVGVGANAGMTVRGVNDIPPEATFLWGADVDFPLSNHVTIRAQFGFTDFGLPTDEGASGADRWLDLNVRCFPGGMEGADDNSFYFTGGLGRYQKHSGGAFGPASPGGTKWGYDVGAGVLMLEGHGPGGFVFEALYHSVPDNMPSSFVTLTLGLELWF
jgi:hypothetical protein